MRLPENQFTRAIRGGGAPQVGLWSSLANPVAAELCAGTGFDWMLIDGEHSPNDLRTVLAQLQAVAAYPTSAIVRPPVGDAVLIKQLLDIGAQSLLIPMVDTAEQAEAMARAVCYPPHGVRGVAAQTRAGRWGRIPDYLATARSELCLIVQIESVIGLSNVDEIAAVDGVDALFVGPADLAASLGHLGEPGHPEVRQAIAHVKDRASAHGKPLGTLAVDTRLATGYIEDGFAFVAVGMDTMLLGQALTTLRGNFPPGTA
jgi:4-hydroxy-2-oxoheptanedioate aldolase